MWQGELRRRAQRDTGGQEDVSPEEGRPPASDLTRGHCRKGAQIPGASWDCVCAEKRHQALGFRRHRFDFGLAIYWLWDLGKTALSAKPQPTPPPQ